MNNTKNKLNSSKNKLKKKIKEKVFFIQHQTQPTIYRVTLFSLYCSLSVALYIICRIVQSYQMNESE